MASYQDFKGNIENLGLSVVLNSEHQFIPLSRFWTQQTAILVFLRHFGCISCRSHAQDVWETRDHLQKNGAKIIFIGNGSPKNIEEFRNNYHLKGAPIFTDPTLKVFQAAGFNHGLSYMLKPSSAVNMAKLAIEGHSNGNPFAKGSGSNRQMGGIIVVHPGAKIGYYYVSEAIGDTPDAKDIKCSID